MNLEEKLTECLREFCNTYSEAAAKKVIREFFPEERVMVPQRMELTPTDIASIMFHCGGDEGSTDVEEMYVGGILWVGEVKDDDGNLVHGLHIATMDYPEEGSTTLVEFDRGRI